MPAIERVIPLVGHLPASIREALVRRLRELAGLALIALSGVAAAALMTWSVQDPSLSHATSRAIRNIVGYPGAIGADLLMQIVGLGAIMLILPDCGVGLAHADPPHLRPRSAADRMLDSLHGDRSGLRQLLDRMAGRGRCRPGLAASSATRWCARPPWCSDRPASSIASCSGSSCSRRWSRPSCSHAAWARGRRKRN